MGRKRLKPEITEELLGGNPLTATDFTIYVRKVKKSRKGTKGEHITVEEELEVEKFVKVYAGAGNRTKMGELGVAAKHLFLWLIYELDSGHEYVWINIDRYMEEMEISSVNTYKTAIAELVRKRFMALSLIKDVYFINPRLFFCGSRVNKYRDNVREWESKKSHGE